MISRVKNERQQEKAAGRAASQHKGSSLRKPALDGLWVIAEQDVRKKSKADMGVL